jgi:soluble lytic murein transglycosylase-like protein
LLSRRLVLIAAAAAAGGLLALGGQALIEKINEPRPLVPGKGEAQSSVVVPWLPDTVKRWTPKIEQYSGKYNVDPNVASIIMTVESAGDPNADSGQAQGLMQISPARAKDLLKWFPDMQRSAGKLKDPETSIELGIANIRHLTDTFGTPEQAPSWDRTVALVAAGYNGGEGAANLYDQHGLAGIKSNQQTYNYVRFVSTMWKERHDDKSFAYRYWYDDANGKALVGAAQKYVRQ